MGSVALMTTLEMNLYVGFRQIIIYVNMSFRVKFSTLSLIIIIDYHSSSGRALFRCRQIRVWQSLNIERRAQSLFENILHGPGPTKT